jgi:hypothetical protein
MSGSVLDPGLPSQDRVVLPERDDDDGAIATEDADATAVGPRVLSDTADDASVHQNRNPWCEVAEVTDHWTSCGEWPTPMATARSRHGRAKSNRRGPSKVHQRHDILQVGEMRKSGQEKIDKVLAK